MCANVPEENVPARWGEVAVLGKWCTLLIETNGRNRRGRMHYTMFAHSHIIINPPIITAHTLFSPLYTTLIPTRKKYNPSLRVIEKVYSSLPESNVLLRRCPGSITNLLAVGGRVFRRIRG